MSCCCGIMVDCAGMIVLIVSVRERDGGWRVLQSSWRRETGVAEEARTRGFSCGSTISGGSDLVKAPRFLHYSPPGNHRDRTRPCLLRSPPRPLCDGEK